MIAIFDYGAGNLRSVQNTLAELNCEYTLINDSAGLRSADKILLPGVGHFGQMMRALDTLGVREALVERIAAGVPFFGICLGMQALFDRSEEAPDVRGSASSGVVRRFPMNVRVPTWVESAGAGRALRVLRAQLRAGERVHIGRLHLRAALHGHAEIG